MRTPELYDGYLRDFDGKEQRIGWALDSSKVREFIENISQEVEGIAQSLGTSPSQEISKIYDNFSNTTGEIDSDLGIKIKKIWIDIVRNSFGNNLFLQFFEGEPILFRTPKKTILLPSFGTVLIDRDFLSPGLNIGNWFAISKVNHEYLPPESILINVLISYEK